MSNHLQRNDVSHDEGVRELHQPRRGWELLVNGLRLPVPSPVQPKPRYPTPLFTRRGHWLPQVVMCVESESRDGNAIAVFDTEGSGTPISFEGMPTSEGIQVARIRAQGARGCYP